MLKILNIDPENFSAEATAILRTSGKLVQKRLSRRQLIQQISGYDALFMRFAHQIDREVLQQAKHLKTIGCNVTGLDHIELEAAKQYGIKIFSLKNEYKFLKTVTATAEHTWGLLLALIRHLPASIDSVKKGNWDRNSFVGHELMDKRLGIVGYGRIGHMVARYAQAFRMDVHVHTKNAVGRMRGIKIHSTLASLLKNTDILTLHVPLNVDTMGLIAKKELNLLPPNALLINTSRGAVVDQSSLLWALRSKRLKGAAIDVLVGEGDLGFPKNHALVAYARANSNLLITPHTGGAAWEAWRKTEVFVAQKMAVYLKSLKLKSRSS